MLKTRSLSVSVQDQECLHLYDISGHLTVNDIMRTCPNLVELSLHYSQNDNDNGNDNDNDNNNDNSSDNSNKHSVHSPNDQCVLSYLQKIDLGCMGDQLCSESMLISVLQSPNLTDISMVKLDAMSNDVMFNVLTSHYTFHAPLSRVRRITLYCCALVTEAPLVHWLTMEECILEDITFRDCQINYNALQAAVKSYPRPLSIIKRSQRF